MIRDFLLCSLFFAVLVQAQAPTAPVLLPRGIVNAFTRDPAPSTAANGGIIWKRAQPRPGRGTDRPRQSAANHARRSAHTGAHQRDGCTAILRRPLTHRRAGALGDRAGHGRRRREEGRRGECAGADSVSRSVPVGAVDQWRRLRNGSATEQRRHDARHHRDRAG